MPNQTDTIFDTERVEVEIPEKKGRRRGPMIVVVVLLAIAAGTYAYIRLVGAGSQSTDDASVGGNQVVVSAQILGRIASMTAAEGSHVSKGERLVTLDNGSLAALESQQQANEELAAQNVTLAQVKLQQAQADFNRAAIQYKSKIIPQEQYDHLRIAVAAAQAGYDIAVAQEKLAASQVATAKSNLAETTIASPINGVVAKRWAMPGDVVQPAQSIYTLFDLSHLWVKANFKETQLVDLKVGDSATVTVDAFPGRTFTGKVQSIGAGTDSQFALIPANNASGNFTKVTQRVPVRISIENVAGVEAHTGRRLLPGMSAEVTVRTGKE